MLCSDLDEAYRRNQTLPLQPDGLRTDDDSVVHSTPRQTISLLRGTVARDRSVWSSVLYGVGPGNSDRAI